MGCRQVHYGKVVKSHSSYHYFVRMIKNCKCLSKECYYDALQWGSVTRHSSSKCTNSEYYYFVWKTKNPNWGVIVPDNKSALLQNTKNKILKAKIGMPSSALS